MNAKWERFIEEYITTSDHIAAYQNVYAGSSRKTAATKGLILLKKKEIAEQVISRQRTKQALIEQARNQKIKEQATDKILSELELDALMSQIATGTLEIDKVFIDRTGAAKSIKVKPDHSERINAMNALYRRYGSFTQDRKNPLDPKPDSYSIEELTQILNKNLSLLKDE